MKKSVAVIGAGPAGIITARKLLQCGLFTVTMFEKNNQIGGSWTPDGIINPNMRTNQSKFTMGFSDLAWDFLEHASVYPKASDIHRYLEEYFERYIPADILHLCTSVTQAMRVPACSDDIKYSWRLRLHEDTPGGKARDFDATFDYLVAAPGFYNVPKMPRSKVTSAPNIPVLHSTEYRNLSDITRNLRYVADVEQKILVVGGSHSGGDIAALIAMQLSDAQYSPESSVSARSTCKSTKVVHVSSHEMSALPAFTKDSRAATCIFEPIDFTLFNRSNRPMDPPPIFSVGLVTPEKITASRKMVHTFLDGDEGSVDNREISEYAPVGILGDNYAQFIKTGLVSQVRGVLTRLENISESSQVTATVEIVGKQQSVAIDNVCAVIYATGFDTAASFAFLSHDIKTDLDYDPSCCSAPFVLDDDFLSRNSSVPELTLVGFPGAYWPLFEMQARATVLAWNTSSSSQITSTKADLARRHQLREYFRELRRAFKEGKKGEIPHNPFGDVVGALEQAYRQLDLDRFDLGFSEVEGFVCSARFLDPGNDKSEAMKTLLEVQAVRKRGKDGGFLARAVMRGLLGEWVAAGKNTDGRIKIVQLSFLPRYPTHTDFDWEYLVIRTENNRIIRNVYRYSEITDHITVWGVSEDGLSTGTLQSMFQFKHPHQEHGKDTAVAVLVSSSNTKQVVDGLTVFRFHFAGSSLKTWTAGIAGRSTIPDLNFVRVGMVGQLHHGRLLD